MPTDFYTQTASGDTGTQWNTWVGTTTSQTVNYTMTWAAWATNTTTAYITNAPYQPPAPETTEERERREERDRARENEWEERRQLQEEARERARETLRELVGEDQWRRYENERGIEVEGSDGYRYVVGKGSSGNVKMFDGDDFLARICFHPSMYDGDGYCLPEADVHISQILTLLNDADLAHHVANVHTGNLPDDVLARRNANRTVAQEQEPLAA